MNLSALTREISILQSMIDSNAGLNEKITLLEKENSNLSTSVKALESEERKIYQCWNQRKIQYMY